jgi:hypothetical protein
MNLSRRGLLGSAAAIAALTILPRRAFAATNTGMVWRVRTGGSNINGGGYDGTVASAGTDYSQQNAAQWTSSSVTSSGTSCTDNTAQGTLTTALIGNAVWMSGAAYTVLTVPTANTFTVDRAPSVTTVVAHIGGAWADPWTNISSSATWITIGNIVSIRGSGSMFPTSPDYTMNISNGVALISGSTLGGIVRFIGENGRPMLTNSQGTLFSSCGTLVFENIKFQVTGSGSGNGLLQGVGSSTFLSCIFDQNGIDFPLTWGVGIFVGCEFYSSVAPGSAGGSWACYGGAGGIGGCYLYCNIHDAVGNGIFVGKGGDLSSTLVYGCLVAKCRGVGIGLNPSGGAPSNFGVLRNTVDGNLGHGVNIQDYSQMSGIQIASNLITNHTQSGKFGLAVTASGASVAATQANRGFIDGNQFFGNTNGNYSNISAGPDDVVLGSTPYAAQSTEGYDPVAALANTGFPLVAFPQALAGMTATQTYMAPGGAQL